MGCAHTSPAPRLTRGDLAHAGHRRQGAPELRSNAIQDKWGTGSATTSVPMRTAACGSSVTQNLQTWAATRRVRTSQTACSAAHSMKAPAGGPCGSNRCCGFAQAMKTPMPYSPRCHQSYLVKPPCGVLSARQSATASPSLQSRTIRDLLYPGDPAAQNHASWPCPESLATGSLF